MPTETRTSRQRPDLASRRSAEHGAVGDGIEWLIDNADTYDRLLASIARARVSVSIMQLALDADCVAYDGVDHDSTASPLAGRGIAAALLHAASARPLDVRVLLNATLLLDTTRPLRRFIATAAGPVAGRVRVRGIDRFPQLLHAKIAVIDGVEAFLLGSPFANGYWDDARHHPTDSRRPLRELAGRPIHDVGVRITGAAVRDLDGFFAELWDVAAASEPGNDHAGPRPSRHRAGNSVVRSRGDTRPPVRPNAHARGIRVVRTVPRGSLPSLPDGATEILTAMLDGIARAGRLIYIEHQYLSARPIVAALARALQREPTLEIILVVNQNPDITAYRAWQNALLAQQRWLQHPRVGVFALWTTGPSAARPGVSEINQLFVHSKVLLIDDEWATVGSANLDGVSLHSYGDDFSGRVGRRLFRNVRNFDANIVLDTASLGPLHRRAVADLRGRLWAEHLGLSVAEVGSSIGRGGSALPLWRAAAAFNVNALNGRTTGAPRMTGFVLPYSTQPTPGGQLEDVGVHVDPSRLDLRFDPGWLEVHYSPNWVRNMFL